MVLVWIAGGTTLLAASLVGGLLLFDRPSRAPDEPDILQPTIPLLGHIYGFLRHRVFYFNRLANTADAPIFSISIFNQKVYIVTDPSLTSALHREKSIFLDVIVLKIVESVVGDSPIIISLMQPTPLGVTNQYTQDIYNTLHDSMVPGPSLWVMNARVLSSISNLVNPIGNDWQEKNFWLWVRDSFSAASSEALFGVHHPLSCSSLVADLWEFDDQQLTLMGVRPPFSSLFPPARRALQAQERVRRALHKYHNERRYLDPSVATFVSARINANLKHGVPMSEISNSSLSHLFVSTTNAVPTLFWSELYIWSNERLVRELRAELESSDVTSRKGNTIRIHHTRLNSCVLLCAAYWETMRLTNVQPGARAVKKDTILRSGDNEYGFLLKRGSIVTSPASVIHRSPKIWGLDAEDFRLARWLSLTKEQKRAYIPFGGGKHLCPGRDFAFAEIVGTLAVLLLGFELRGFDGGFVKMPEGRRNKYGVLGPDGDGRALKVTIKRREGWEDIVWEFGSIELDVVDPTKSTPSL